jgi:hypothetical protein
MFPAGQILLMALSWILVFRMIRTGLKQIKEKKGQLTPFPYEPSPS